MDELGITPNDVVLRYCAVLSARGLDAKPINKRNMIYRILDGKVVPKYDTLRDIVEALGGEFKVVWRMEKEVSA